MAKEWLLAPYLTETGPNRRIYVGSRVRSFRPTRVTPIRATFPDGNPIDGAVAVEHYGVARNGTIKAFTLIHGIYRPIVLWDDTGEARVHYGDLVAIE